MKQLDQYPTPETDDAMFEVRGRTTPIPDEVVYVSFSRNMEQRFAACREALEKIDGAGGSFSGLLEAQRTARETLELTKP